MWFLLFGMVLLLNSCQNKGTTDTLFAHGNYPASGDTAMRKDVSSIQINTDNPPRWLLDFINEPIDTFIDFSHQHYTAVDSYTKLNDSIDLVLYSIGDGVCLHRYVATFVQAKVKDQACIQISPDHDLSQPMYRYREFSSSNNRIFHVYDVTDKPLYDSVLTSNGRFREGINFDDTEITSDTITYDIKVLSSGILAGKHDE